MSSELIQKISVRKCLVGLLVLVCPPGMGAAEEDVLVLTLDGRPASTIVIPSAPEPGESRAAEELQAYVRKVSGARLPIAHVGDEIAGVKILLGRASRSEDLATPSGDGFAIRSFSDAIAIVGSGQRGTLYGVYAFLEDQLGIRWYTSEEIGEVVPKRKTIRVRPINTREEPDFEYRWIGRGSEWSARTRNNVALPEIGVEVFGSAHTFRTFLDPNEYFQQHPDWYAMVDGRRVHFESTTHRNQICTSNPQAIRQVIRNMQAHLDAHPETDVITLFPNDGTGFCECDACKALDEPGWASVEDYNRLGRATGLAGYGAISRRLMIFNNAVARALGQSHPGVMVKVGAYSCYTNPPHDTSLVHEDNVLVQICHSWCHNHAICDPDCEVNADFRKAIEGWSRITPGGVMLYEYYYKVAQCELPFPILHAMREDIPYFKQIGVKGIYTQYTDNWGTLTLPYYLATRLLWNADADVDAITDEFYAKFYGPAAGPMKQYYERLERAAVESGHHFSAPYYRFPEVFTADCLADCRRHLDEAQQLATTNVVRRRLAMVETSLVYTEMVMDYVNAVRAVDEAASPPRWLLDRDPAAFDEAQEKAEAIRQFLTEPRTQHVVRDSNYVARLLNPSYTAEFRFAQTDPRSAQRRKEVALTRPEWLADHRAVTARPRPKTFDLWVYGYDFDGGGETAEHELVLLDASGGRLAVLPLPPQGQACNRQNGCAVYQNLAWPEPGADVLRFEVVKRPNQWQGSTLLAIYVLPGGEKISPAKAAQEIRDEPEQTRAASLGFVEFGYRGLDSKDGPPSRVDIAITSGR